MASRVNWSRSASRANTTSRANNSSRHVPTTHHGDNTSPRLSHVPAKSRRSATTSSLSHSTTSKSARLSDTASRERQMKTPLPGHVQTPTDARGRRVETNTTIGYVYQEGK